jgi:hypothetical protein
MTRSAREPSDVFQATRQPFDPGSPATGLRVPWAVSYVEGLWSPSLVLDSEKTQAKAHAYSRCYSTLRAGGVFLSQAGPRFGPMSSSSWASPRGRIDEGPLQTTKGDPLGRPRLARNAARELACTPPSEGYDMVELEPDTGALPGRDHRGWGRSGRVRRGVDRGQHLGSVSFRPSRIEHPSGLRKGSREEDSIRSSVASGKSCRKCVTHECSGRRGMKPPAARETVSLEPPLPAPAPPRCRPSRRRRGAARS